MNEDFVKEPDIYELSELAEVVPNLPLTSYFEETKYKASEHTFGSWLKTIDADTLNMLIRNGEKTLWEDETNHTPEDENDAIDYLYLVLFVVGFELQTLFVPRTYLDKSMSHLYVLAVGEHLSRLGLCTVTGSNSLLGEDTCLQATPESKILLDEINRRKGKK